MTDVNEISGTGPVLNENCGSESISRDLWCLYIAGPDDLVAMPTKAVAEAVARNFNAVWDRYAAERGHDVRAVAHVEPWMHGKDAHTKDLREHFYEYADLVLDEDPARFKPVQPVEAVDESALSVRAFDDGWLFSVPGMMLSIWDEKHDPEAGVATVVLRACARALTHPRPTGAFDFVAHLQRQREWSGKTFGPGSRVLGVVDHIRKELKEIEADPGDLKEWIDVVILALDGAWRSGARPQEIMDALVAKQTKNEGRVWPDWRTADPNKAIEHDRARDEPTPTGEQAGEVQP